MKLKRRLGYTRGKLQSSSKKVTVNNVSDGSSQPPRNTHLKYCEVKAIETKKNIPAHAMKSHTDAMFSEKSMGLDFEYSERSVFKTF